MTDSAPAGQPLYFRRIKVSETVALRHSVLWPNEPVSYVCLPEDETGYHFGAFLTPGSGDQSEPVAVISLFIEPIPITAEDTSSVASPEASSSKLAPHLTGGLAVRFRKFACNPTYQSRGIGTQLLLHVFSVVRSELQATVVWCDARTSTAEWYRRRGMAEFGNVFYKSTVQYIRMRIDLTKSHEIASSPLGKPYAEIIDLSGIF